MHDDRPQTGDPFTVLRRDHARVLDRLAALEARVLGGIPFEEDSLRSLVALLERQFLTHMAAEEQVLYPAMRAAFPEARGTLEPLRADHAELRQLLAALAALLSRPRDRGRDEQVGVLARDLSDLLRLHIRREESVVLDVAPRVLSAAQVEAMATTLDTWRDGDPETPAHRAIERKKP